MVRASLEVKCYVRTAPIFISSYKCEILFGVTATAADSSKGVALKERCLLASYFYTVPAVEYYFTYLHESCYMQETLKTNLIILYSHMTQ